MFTQKQIYFSNPSTSSPTSLSVQSTLSHNGGVGSQSSQLSFQQTTSRKGGGSGSNGNTSSKGGILNYVTLPRAKKTGFNLDELFMDSPSVGGVYYKSSGTSSVGSHTPSPKHINNNHNSQHQLPKHQQQQHYQNSSFKRNPAAAVGFSNRNNMVDQSLRGKSQYVKYIEDQQQQQQQQQPKQQQNHEHQQQQQQNQQQQHQKPRQHQQKQFLKNKLLTAQYIHDDGSDTSEYEDVDIAFQNTTNNNNTSYNSNNNSNCDSSGNTEINRHKSSDNNNNNNMENYDEDTGDTSGSRIDTEGFQENNNLVLPLGGRLRANSNSKKEKVNAIIW